MGDDAVGYVLPHDLHASLSHEDAFFSTEGLSVGLVHLALDHFKLRLVEVTSRVSEDRSASL